MDNMEQPTEQLHMRHHTQPNNPLGHSLCPGSITLRLSSGYPSPPPLCVGYMYRLVVLFIIVVSICVFYEDDECVSRNILEVILHTKYWGPFRDTCTSNHIHLAPAYAD